MNNYTGKLVTVEGIDASGKSTLATGLNREMDIETTTEPSSLYTGKWLRKMLEDESSDPLSDFFMFMADRQAHIKQVIEPALGDGDIVVSDRYADSTRAYQPIMLEDYFDWPMVFIDSTMDTWSLEPDLTIYLDISVDTSMERLGRKDKNDKYEKRETIEKVQENYEKLAKLNSDRFVRIDGEQPKEDVLEEAIEIIWDERV